MSECVYLQVCGSAEGLKLSKAGSYEHDNRIRTKSMKRLEVSKWNDACTGSRTGKRGKKELGS